MSLLAYKLLHAKGPIDDRADSSTERLVRLAVRQFFRQPAEKSPRKSKSFQSLIATDARRLQGRVSGRPSRLHLGLPSWSTLEKKCGVTSEETSKRLPQELSNAAVGFLTALVAPRDEKKAH